MPKKQFILGTDWWTDCDDAVAVRILARAHKENKICLKAIGINACMEHSVTSLDGFLNAEGVTDVPIGIDLDATDFDGKPPYQKNLAPYAVRYTCNEQAEDAVKLYRRVLAESEEKLEIIEIGFLNVASQLLDSEADEISDKTGLELVCEKVSKFWVMAGKWDEDGGMEHNFCLCSRSRRAGDSFCRKCPVPVTFLGWETGASVISGSHLQKDDILSKLMCDHGSYNGRDSWDPMTVLMALVGDEAEAGYSTVCGTASVDPQTGANHFEASDSGMHKYVVKAQKDSFYEEWIDRLIGDN